MRDEIDSGFVPNFLASQINKLVADSKVTYTEQTIRYARNIVDLIWKDTIYKFSESAYDLACRNMDLVIKNILASLESDMNIVPQKISYGIALQQALEKAERKFNDCLTECQMPDWDINLNAKRIEFTDQLDNKSLLLKKEECFRLSNTANKKYLGSFSRTFGSLLFGMDNEDELKRMYLNVIESELEALVALTESTRTELILSEEALKTWMNTEIDKFNEEIVKIIKYEFSERKIIDRIVAKFEHDFLYDESKLPRVWNDVQAVDIYYQDAISFAFKKLRQFEDDENWLNDFKTGRLGKIYPKIPSPFLDIELISSIEIHLQKIFDRRYIEAKKSTLSSNTHIPAWVYLLILVLGWNEIISIISSPLYLIISIILLSIAISIYTFNLMPYIQIGLTFVVNTLQSNALNSKAPTSSKSEHNY